MQRIRNRYDVRSQTTQKEKDLLSWSIFQPHEKNRETIATWVRWRRRTKCSRVFHMGNHVAIPSNQIGNRCEDDAQQWLKCSSAEGDCRCQRKPRDSRDVACRWRDTHAFTFYLCCVVLIRHPANDELIMVPRTRHQIIFPSIRY